MRAALAALLAAWAGLAMAAPADSLVVSMGKQRAQRLGVQWEVRDVDHPVLGPIKVAVPKTGVLTPVQDVKIVSAAFVSCQKRTGRIAIELANSIESNPNGGLMPTEMPHLVCNRPDGVKVNSLATSPIEATWKTNELGDAMAQGLAPGMLRLCVSIDILQSVTLPVPAPLQGNRIAMEIAPYGRELDEVFSACGEKTAFAAEARKPKPEAAPDGGSWKIARTVAQGKTNVRAGPGIDSRAVVQLPPGARIEAQLAVAPWWKVRPLSRKGFSGYVREDRLVFE
jgi:hypothetical protein